MKAFRIEFVECTNYSKNVVRRNSHNDDFREYLDVENGAIIVVDQTAEQACSQVEHYGRGIKTVTLLGSVFTRKKTA